MACVEAHQGGPGRRPNQSVAATRSGGRDLLRVADRPSPLPEAKA